MGRAWLLGIAILVVGLAGEREDGLMAALLALVAFSVYLATTLIIRPHGEEHAQPMSQSRKILLGAGGAYLLLVVLAFILFGSAGRNEDFAPQEEFELPTWIELRAARHQQGGPLPRPLRDPDLRVDGLHRQPDAGQAEPHPDRGRDALRR